MNSYELEEIAAKADVSIMKFQIVLPDCLSSKGSYLVNPHGAQRLQHSTAERQYNLQQSVNTLLWPVNCYQVGRGEMGDPKKRRHGHLWFDSMRGVNVSLMTRLQTLLNFAIIGGFGYLFIIF